MNYKLPINTIEYILEVNLDIDETHSHINIKRTGIQQGIPTIMLSEQEIS